MASRVSLIVAALLVLLVGLVQGQEPAQSPLQGVIMGSLWNDNHFSKPVNLGAKLGFIVPIDSDRGMAVWTTYAKWELRDDASASALTNTLIIDWYVGKKWTFYTTLIGAETYVSGPITGTDLFTGVGVGRRLLTDDNPAYKVPFYMDAFIDITVSKDADWQVTETELVDDYIQINFGLKFGRPIKL